MAKISTTTKKKRIIRTHREPEHNYLKYWRVVSYWARKKYDITSAELDMLLYLYDLPYFKREDFNYYGKTMSWDKKRFISMKRKGLVKLWRQGGDAGSRAYLYELTLLGKTICRNVYKKLEGEPISENSKYNPITKKETFSDKMYSKVIEAMNATRRSDND
jgi:hypothetical protein